MYTPAAGPQALRDTGFANPRLARPGIEVMSLASLWRRGPCATMLRPERIDFFMLLLVERGRGDHMVDFTPMKLQAGSLVFVQPGQVQQWQRPAGLSGLMLMVDPPVLNPDTTRSALQRVLAREWQGWPAHAVLPAHERPPVRAWMKQLADECDAFDGSELSTAMMRSLLACLWLQVARAQARAPGAGAADLEGAHALVRQLRAAIEAQLRDRPTVHGLAAGLGYSASTINRACQVVEGRNAKAVIDRRIALEAQRLLVHSSEPSAQVGLSLGFSEPTNFLKFFRRVVGSTPDAFRRRYGGDA